MKYLATILLPLSFIISAIISPAYASEKENLILPDKAMGSGFGVQVKEWRTSSEELDDIKDMGAQYLRFGFEWQVVEKVKDVYDWSLADHFMQQIKSKDIYAVYEVGGLNALYSPMIDTLPNKPMEQGRAMPAAPTTPESLAAMEKFITETVRRYHGDHIIWEIWNEPDMNTNWPPEVNVTDFTKIISATCTTIKQADPNATVVGPALAYLPSRNENGHGNFLATILKSPAGACLDAISIHPYRHGDQPPETAMKDYEDIRTYIARNTPPGHKKLPIISSEWGYSLAEVTPEQQAAYALRSLIINNLSGIPVSIWYEWRDSLKDQSASGTQDREAHFGLRDYDNGAKISFKVMNEILPHLRNTHVEKRIAMGDENVYALLLKDKAGNHELLFWLADRAVREPLGIQINDRNESMTYPVNIIPTLVCTGPAPAILPAANPAQADQGYYVPCSH